MTERHVILDLDSTLIYSRRASLSKRFANDDRNFWISPLNVEFFRVSIRKHLDIFLDQLYAKGYKIIVWSAGGKAYVNDIVSVIFKNRPIEYLLTSENLDDRGLKDLNIIKEYMPGFTLKNARLVDDNPDHRKGQEDFCVEVKPFVFDGECPTSDEDDDVLLTMAERIDKSFS